MRYYHSFVSGEFHALLLVYLGFAMLTALILVYGAALLAKIRDCDSVLGVTLIRFLLLSLASSWAVLSIALYFCRQSSFPIWWVCAVGLGLVAERVLQSWTRTE